MDHKLRTYGTPKDLYQKVEEALTRFHNLGYTPGDVTLSDFEVDPAGNVKLVNFAGARRLDNFLTNWYCKDRDLQRLYLIESYRVDYL